MKRFVLAASATVVLCSAAGPAAAAAALLTDGSAYIQNFDALSSAGTSSALPDGVVFVESGANANSTYAVSDGTANAGDTYSFGQTGQADRAFGGILSQTLIPTVGLQFTNMTGQTIIALTIDYAGEQWRLGASGRQDKLDFQYSTDATSLSTGSWTNADALDFLAPVQSGSFGALNGNALANRTLISSTITGLWLAFDAAGPGDGLAIDDFTLTPTLRSVAPPQVPILGGLVLMATGLAAGALRRGRKRRA